MTKTPALLKVTRALLHGKAVSMLRVSDTNCKLEFQVCPVCGARGNFTGHGSYERSLVKLLLDIPIELSIKVKRVKCRSCKRTHALIPVDVVPYCHHSVSLCAKLFELKWNKDKTIMQICMKLDLSPTTFYRIYHRSIGRLLLLGTELSSLQEIGSLCANLSVLTEMHLKTHRIKPFEHGRLAPIFFDP